MRSSYDELSPQHRVLDEACGIVGRDLAELLSTAGIEDFDGPPGSHVLGHPYVTINVTRTLTAQSEVPSFGYAVERERDTLTEIRGLFMRDLAGMVEGARQLAWGVRPQLRREYDPTTGDLLCSLSCRLVAWKDHR